MKTSILYRCEQVEESDVDESDVDESNPEPTHKSVDVVEEFLRKTEADKKQEQAKCVIRNRRSTIVIYSGLFSIFVVVVFMYSAITNAITYSRNIGHRVTNDVSWFKSEVAALRDDNLNIQKILADVQMLLAQDRIEAEERQQLEEMKTTDGNSPFRYSIKEVQTLQRLNLIDRFGNECIEPLQSHESVCREVFRN